MTYDPRLDGGSPSFDRAALLAHVLTSRWYVLVNDEVGGWAVGACDRSVRRTSELVASAGERVVVDGVFAVEVARHVAELHNDARDRDRRPTTDETDDARRTT